MSWDSSLLVGLTNRAGQPRRGERFLRPEGTRGGFVAERADRVCLLGLFGELSVVSSWT